MKLDKGTLKVKKVEDELFLVTSGEPVGLKPPNR